MQKNKQIKGKYQTFRDEIWLSLELTETYI
jgi:hypothetical protein